MEEQSNVLHPIVAAFNGVVRSIKCEYDRNSDVCWVDMWHEHATALELLVAQAVGVTDLNS